MHPSTNQYFYILTEVCPILALSAIGALDHLPPVVGTSGPATARGNREDRYPDVTKY